MAKIVLLEVEQGSTFTKNLIVKDDAGVVIDLTGYTVEGKIKKMFTSFVGFNFTIAVNDAATGDITLSLTDEQTGGITAGTYVYDVRIISGAGVATRVFEGTVEVSPSVSGSNPFVAVGGVRFTDPRIVHVHENKEVLDQIQDISQIPTPWKKVDADNYVASNGDRIFLDTTVSILNVIVPDTPTDYSFVLEVSDYAETFGANKAVIKNESDAVIYEATTAGHTFKIVWTDATGGYKIIQ